MADLDKQRILVVEDKSLLSDLYRHHLEDAGYLVDVAERSFSAIDALRAKFYDLALVDLMLKEDVTHKGGFEVLDTINVLQDGTRAIVVSGTVDIRDAVASQNRGAVSFLMKGEFDAKELVGAVKKALDGYRRSYVSDISGLIAYLAAPEVPPLWEGHVKTTLECSYEITQKILWKSLNRYLPLLRKKDGAPTLELHRDQKGVSGSFWSKATGHAIWYSASAATGKLIEPVGQKLQRLADYDAKNVVAAVWRIDVARDEFMECIRDRPG
jgi:CheY-like chemotaxis protein